MKKFNIGDLFLKGMYHLQTVQGFDGSTIFLNTTYLFKEMISMPRDNTHKIKSKSNAELLYTGG
jgi:hypothetical protein